MKPSTSKTVELNGLLRSGLLFSLMSFLMKLMEESSWKSSLRILEKWKPTEQMHRPQEAKTKDTDPLLDGKLQEDRNSTSLAHYFSGT